VAQRNGKNLIPEAGESVDLAAFGRLRWWTGTEKQDLHFHPIVAEADGSLRPAKDPESGEWHLGIEWDEMRDVRQVAVQYAGTVPTGLKVQYWRYNWPTPAPERLPGARRGWIARDDPFHGRWIAVKAEKVVKGPAYSAGQGSTCTFIFDPIDVAELGGRSAIEDVEAAKDYLARFRQTLKIRLVSKGEEVPVVKGVQAYSAARWLKGQVNVHFPEGAGANWSGHVEAQNGHILGTEPLDKQDTVPAVGTWQCNGTGNSKGVRLDVLYSDAGPESTDRTIVTLWTGARSFSFQLADLQRGPIYIPDYGVFITWANAPVDLTAFKAELAKWPRSIYDRVPGEPEQSLQRALSEIPPLDPTIQGVLGRYLPIGVDAGRQEWVIRWNAELFADKDGLKLLGRDAAHLIWPGHQIRFRFATGDPADFHERRGAVRQSLLDGWVPVITSRWEDREFSYEQTAFGALLDGPMTPEEERRGDENVVAMLRFVIRNTTHASKRTRLWMAVSPQEAWELQDGFVVARGRVVPAEPVARQWRVDAYDEPVLRCAIHTWGRGQLAAVAYAEASGASEAIPTAIAYDVGLEGGESHTITMAFPFVSLAGKAEWQKVARLDLEAKLADVIAYWRGVVGAGGQIEIPDALLNDFHKAVQAHVAISVDKDPASGLLSVPAATYRYGVCANEACWQISMLDQAGHHERAGKYLETFLATQGMSHLDGNFISNEGLMQGLNIDDGEPLRSGFAYNLDPGYIMETLAQHYRLSGDRTWLQRVAPKLVSACDFIIRERQRTKLYEEGSGDQKPVPEWGLMPAGHLEDNQEWRHWFAVNAHAYGGMRTIAAALSEIAHPEAPRLTQEAAAYQADIRQAARRAMVEAPVVSLLDGTYIPRIPTHTSMRGRDVGWIREAAYGPLHLCECDVFDPSEEEMTWVLKDLEDNLFVTREFGRPVDLERFWFSHGGVTIQANLMDLAIDYLRRGEVKNGLRALFNNFGASLYTDVRAFTEHPVIELGHGVGPFYKVSDEGKALVWLRAFLLREEGNTLHLAPGAPCAWFAPGQAPWGLQKMASEFGPVSYRVSPGSNAVTVEVQAAFRRPPAELCVHLRRPDGVAPRTVTVNGRPAVFDADAEAVRIPAPGSALQIRAEYDA